MARAVMREIAKRQFFTATVQPELQLLGGWSYSPVVISI
jgi:hypothetical protein